MLKSNYPDLKQFRKTVPSIKQLCTLLLCLISIQAALAQEKTKTLIKGNVHTSDGQAAVGVSISLKGTGNGTTTNNDGGFELKNVSQGNYTISASAVGLKPSEKTIVIGNDGVYEVDFILSLNAEQLKEVIISGRNSKNKPDGFAAKMPLKNLENPQVYNTVSAELMKEQAITNYDDAFRNVPGISRTWESTGRGGDGGAYFALRGFDAQPALLNGLPGLTSGNLDPANVEEIQVIKGPSGTLFGGAFFAYGGIINTITKKPYDHFGGEVSYNFGSFGLNRVTADINTPLSKTEKIALRINTAYHSENSFQDAGFKKSFFLAPSLAYEVNDRLSFLLTTEILEEERAVPPVFFHSDRESPLPFKNLEELNLNRNASFTNNDLTIKNPRYTFQGQMNYKLSDAWTSQTVISRGAVKSDGYYTYMWDDHSGDKYFEQYFHKEQQTTNTTDIQQNFNGDFKIGGLRNRLLLGLDFYNQNVIDNGSGWAVARRVTPQSGEEDYIDPETGDTTGAIYLNRALVDAALADQGSSNSNISNNIYSAYFSDVLNIAPSLSIMASLRADYFTSKGEKTTGDGSYNQFGLSPKFGIVYQPLLDKLSVFANYMNGFVNVAPMEVGDADGNNLRMKSFKPEQANQWEGGIKANLAGDKLFATVSLYDIKVSNRVIQDAGNRYNYTQGGKVGSKGFELDLTATPVNGLNILAGYSYNETKVLVGDEDDFYAEVGRSPGGQGPQHLANFWATYRFLSGKLQNFGFGLGGNYAGKYKVIDSSITGDFILPSYALLNASVFYNSDKIRVTCNVNNVTDTEYYIGYWSVNPQKPRNFVTSIAYKF